MTASPLAPVVVFAYRRPDHLRRTLDALAHNTGADQTDVTVIGDGPRNHADASACQEVLREAERKRPFRSITVLQRETNLGLAQSIISGVSQMLARNERIIVLEDDIMTSPAFLPFMNKALERYSTDDRVISVHGYSYPTEIQQPFFLRGADCWGWATWRRGWELFEPDGASLLRQLRNRSLTDAFDFDGTYPYTQMLEDQIVGKNDSWAIRWYASAFLSGKLTLYPGRSLVRNIGNDGSGTHGGATDQFDGELAQQAPDLSDLLVEESSEARAAFERYFRERDGRSQSGPPSSRFSRILQRLDRKMLRGRRK